MRIGIDIGGTKIAFGLIDEDGKLLFFKRVETQKEKEYEQIKRKIASFVPKILSENDLSMRDLKRIGVACAGQIDIKSGVVEFSPNLRWEKVPLKIDIENLFSVETYVENDANAATYGEWMFSFSGEPKNLVGIFLGTGVGGGIIVEGKLVRGENHAAGEIGHMILNPYGYFCNCGSRGCFEAFCGGEYIIGRVKKLLDQGYRGKISELLPKDGEMNISHIENAYYLGDRAIKKIWEEVIEYLGCALTTIANLFNPEIIVVGGGVIKGTRKLLSEAKKIVEKRAMPEAKRGLRIEPSKLGDASAILGVAFIE